MTTYRLNEKFHGVEITFSSKPEAATLDTLKQNGFRWNKKGGYWYAVQTPERLALAEQIAESKTADKVTKESDTTEAEPLTIPEDIAVTGTGLYDGWKGGNSHKWHTDQELKTLILADCKKAGIRASIRFERGGYITSLTATMVIRAEDVQTYAEWCESHPIDQYHIIAGGWNYYTDENGNIKDIFGERVYNLKGAEFDAMKANIHKTDYELFKKYITQSNTYYKEKFEVLAPEAKKRMDTLKAIIHSYNSDCSNTMIDYFARGIYDHYAVRYAA